MVRLLLLALLPQVGGILLMVARVQTQARPCQSLAREDGR
jgi:hypothetical protein